MRPKSLSFLPHVPPDMSDRLNSMWAAHQTTKIIHLWLQTVKSGSNKGTLPIDPIYKGRQCKLLPLGGSVAQVCDGFLITLVQLLIIGDRKGEIF